MDLTPHVTQLRQQLAVAAEAGGEDARALAERLTAPLDSAVRLAMLEILSSAAEEITRDLAPGSVELRLRGHEPAFVVTPPPAEGALPDDTKPASLKSALAGAIEVTMGVRPPAEADEGEGGTSRITLRLPEHLKPRIEAAASSAGLSVNAWLVRAVSSALELGAQTQPT
ncbi:MAG: toxin-antitoxin system HicB family antitoxin [Streptosporangiales bacterium]|nr:toxin-antitoxin system HicB family antitoxin [Streptosporangiales bacterium]